MLLTILDFIVGVFFVVKVVVFLLSYGRDRECIYKPNYNVLIAAIISTMLTILTWKTVLGMRVFMSVVSLLFYGVFIFQVGKSKSRTVYIENSSDSLGLRSAERSGEMYVKNGGRYSYGISVNSTQGNLVYLVQDSPKKIENTVSNKYIIFGKNVYIQNSDHGQKQLDGE